MKKNFKSYAIIWAILFVVFNAFVFIIRSALSKYLKYDASFWISWALIVVAFLGNLICAYFAFKEKNTKKMFYKLPLITISWSALIVALIVGCVFMSIPNCPAWVASIICILVLAFNAIAIAKAKWAGDTVSAIDEKIKVQTSFIKDITMDAENLIEHAKNDVIKAECKRVYEAFRYSDPMSNSELFTIENNIKGKMSDFIIVVDSSDGDVTERVKELASEIIKLIKERNNKCQRLK